MIFLDKTDTAREFSDTADVAQELNTYFPGLLTINRFPTWTALKEDIIQIRLQRNTSISVKDRDDFQAYIGRIASKMQFQGIAAPLGDTNSFWNGHEPKDYTSFSMHAEVVSGL